MQRSSLFDGDQMDLVVSDVVDGAVALAVVVVVVVVSDYITFF